MVSELPCLNRSPLRFSFTHFIVRSNDLVSHAEISILEVSDVKNITTKDLGIFNHELCFPIDDDATSVALLTSRFSVEVGLVKK